MLAIIPALAGIAYYESCFVMKKQEPSPRRIASYPIAIGILAMTILRESDMTGVCHKQRRGKLNIVITLAMAKSLYVGLVLT